METSAIVALAILGLALGGASGARLASGREASRALPRGVDESATELTVPRATSEVRIDGELDDAAWQEAGGRTRAFTKGGNVARPYSDARVLWRDHTLYVALYAADEDIRAPLTQHDAPLWTGDSFQLVFRRGAVERSIDVSPRGTVTDGERVDAGPFDARWESQARVAVDLDGTSNDPSDEDEEWVVEMAIPMETLGLEGIPGERIGLEIRRCDRVRSSIDARETPRRSCAAWGNGRSVMVLQ